MARINAYLLVFVYVLQVVLLAHSSVSHAAPLVVSPTAVITGSLATVSGPGIQPGAKVLVWGGSSVVGTLGLAGRALDIAISGNYAFVAADDAGVHVVDITDPVNASLVTSIATNSNALSISISGNHAYVGGGTDGLDIIDISNPAMPLLLPGTLQPGNATDTGVVPPYAFVTNGIQPVRPALASELETLVLNVPLNDRPRGGIGTSIYVPAGPNKLTLAEISSGNLQIPSTGYNIESHFGSNGGTMIYPGGALDGPLIVGDREDFKALLNFGNMPAIISFWVDDDISSATGGTIISAGPNGSRSRNSGGWSAYTSDGNGKVWFVAARKNNPGGADCKVTTIAGSMPEVTDGNRHHIVIVYDPAQEVLFMYTDGIKGGIRELSGCRANSEGDDSGTAPGKDVDWFTIGEAGQVNNGDLFYDGSVQDVYIFTPASIPVDIDAIVREWYTLGLPGPRASAAL